MSTKAAKSYLRDLMSSACTWLSSKLKVETPRIATRFRMIITPRDYNLATPGSRLCLQHRTKFQGSHLSFFFLPWVRAVVEPPSGVGFAAALSTDWKRRNSEIQNPLVNLDWRTFPVDGTNYYGSSQDRSPADRTSTAFPPPWGREAVTYRISVV